MGTDREKAWADPDVRAMLLKNWRESGPEAIIRSVENPTWTTWIRQLYLAGEPEVVELVNRCKILVQM